MADKVLQSLLVKISADVSDLNAKLDSVVKKTHDSTREMKDSLGELKTIFAEVISAEYIKSVVEYGAHLNTLSQQTGISVEALAQLAYAAKVSGTDIDTLSQSVRLANKNISDAALGTGSAAQSLKDLHLNAKALSGLSPDKQLTAIAGAMEKIGKSSDFTAVGMDIFGRSFAEIAPLVRQGADAIQDMQKAADSLGLTMTKESAEGFNKLSDNVEVLKMESDALSRTLLEKVVPALNDVFAGINQLNNGTTNTSTTFSSIGSAFARFAIDAQKGAIALNSFSLHGSLTDDARSQINDLNALKQGVLDEEYGRKAQAAKSAQEAAEAIEKARRNAIDPSFHRTNTEQAKQQADINKLIDDYVTKLQQKAALEDISNSKKAGEAAYAQLLNALLGKGLTLDQARARVGELRKQQIEDTANTAQIKEENKDIDAQIQKLRNENAVYEEQRQYRAGSVEYYNVVNSLLEKGLTLREAEDQIGEKRKQELIQLGDIKKANEDGAKAADEWQKTLSDGLTNLAFNFKTAGDAAKSFFNTLAQNIFKKSISDPLSTSLVNMLTPSASNSGSVFSSIGSLLGLSGARALGGPVNSGSSYLVGENGPEIFTPGTSGGITPNNKLGGGGTIVVAPVYNISTGVSQTVRAELMSMLPSLDQRTLAVVKQAIQSGGSFSRVISGA